MTCTYDVENHLLTYGNDLEAGYRGDGKRAWKEDDQDTRTYSLYDDDRLLCELDENGSVTATLSWGAAGLFAYDGTQYQCDPQGSVVARVSAGDQVLSTHWYAAHGTEQTTPSTEPFGYEGQWGYYTDRETGLILCTHRYLDPESGRWLTRDPISYAGGVNLYSYCANGAVQRADPAGLLWFLAAIAVADLVGTLISIADGLGTVVGYIESGYPGEALKALPGLVADVGSLSLPGVPGGASLADDAVDLAGGLGRAVPEATASASPLVRGGSSTPLNFTPRPEDLDGLSVFDSLEGAMQRLPKEKKFQVLDPSRFKDLEYKPDLGDPGHGTLVPRDPSQMPDWINSREGLDRGELPHPLTAEAVAAIVETVRRSR